MAVELNHTIVKAHDRRATADFIAGVLGLAEPESFAADHFLILRLANNISLDVMHVDAPIDSEHYAFLVSEREFDEIFSRVQEKEIPYWADPFGSLPNRINTLDGGRGFYFLDPNGHSLEVLTTPYGEESEAFGLRKLAQLKSERN